VQRLASLWNSDDFFGHVGPAPIPSQESVIQVIHQARRILFPGYFTQTRLDAINLEYCLGQECFRYDQPCSKCIELGHETTLQFMQTLPELGIVLATDIRAALEGDPAAKSYDEVIFSYPGLFAVMVYRMAHKLCQLNVPLLPRMMTEYAHSLTGIDIHPGAKIGESFFIDHGTGVVVGETTEIGNQVRLYQGV